MDERMEFIVAYRTGLYSVTELADQFAISRKTAWKYLERYREGGVPGLSDRSRRPIHSPRATAADLVADVLACRRAHPRWGPKKLRAVLRRHEPHRPWPAVSTIARVLHRAGLVHGTRRRARAEAHGGRPPFVAATRPNAVWTTDFKGQFRMRDGRWSYPLTIMDRHSRYLLACQHCEGPTTAAVQAAFLSVFREVGLPDYIHSDNGEPFVGRGLAGLSQLAVWWLRLGIWPERGRLAQPQDNAEHERMHRTLKGETARPPAASRSPQQARFTRFREEYNWERPHEGLELRVPGEIYAASGRPYPATLPDVEYPAHYEIRRATQNGRISWKDRDLFLSSVLRHQLIGLEEVDDGVWDIFLGPAHLGRFDERTWVLAGVRHLRPPP